MQELDETDLEILRLLVEDARRPYSDIAEVVDLSAPAVSDRVDRLRAAGVIRQFTIDVDRSQLREGVSVLVRISVVPDEREAVRSALRDAGPVEHLFEAADGDLVVQGQVPDGDVSAWLDETVEAGVRDYEVTLLTGVEWSPDPGGTGFALECAECGNTVTSEGVAARIGGQRYRFCCPSCRTRFEERYEELEGAAGSG
ncbi:MAG: AsnC family transcriptional regulator [Halorhabdus sp.]